MMALRPGDRNPMVCADRGLPIGLPRLMSTRHSHGGGIPNTKSHPEGRPVYVRVRGAISTGPSRDSDVLPSRSNYERSHLSNVLR